MTGQLDHRQWTQQHLDAADLRLNSMAPTPPQGEIENDCMDVNVRGPGERLDLQHDVTDVNPGIFFKTLWSLSQTASLH